MTKKSNKNRNRFIFGSVSATLVASAVVPAIVPVETVNAAAFNGFEYTVTEGKVTITGYTETAKDINIPSEIDGNPVTIIGKDAFRSKGLTSVVIPSSVEIIERGAFALNGELTSVTLNEGLKSIGSTAFDNTDIKTLDIPSTVEKIETSAFYRNYNLSSLTLREGLTEIQSSAFSQTALVTIEIPSTVKNLAGFNNIATLNKVILNEGLEVIKYGAFRTSDIRELVIPSTVTKVEGYAFESNTNLSKLEFNEGLTRIENYAFSKTSMDSLSFPSTLEFLGSYAFSDNPNLTNLELNEGLKEVGFYSFFGSKVPYVKVPSTVTSIGSGAFNNMGLVKIDLPEGLTSLDLGAFNSNSIQELVIPASVTSIRLDNVYSLPLSSIVVKGAETQLSSVLVESMQRYGFKIYGQEGSKAQTYAEARGEFAQFIPLDEYIEYEDSIGVTEDGLKYHIRHEGVTIYGYDGESPTSVVIPKTIEGKPVVTISKNALDFSSLTDLDITEAEHLKNIESRAFYTAKLTSLDFSNSKNLEYIGESAFRNSQFIELDFRGTKVKMIATSAFIRSELLESLILPDTLKRIATTTFFTEKLNRLVIPESVELIEKSAFEKSHSDILTYTYNNIGHFYILNPNLELTNTNLKLGNNKNRYFFGIKDSTAISFGNRYQNFKKDYPVEIPTGEYVITEDKYFALVHENEVTLLSYLGIDKDLVLPDTIEGKPVTRIHDRGFSYMGLTSVVFPKYLKLIGDNAFEGNNIETLKIPSTIETLGVMSFYNSGVKNLTIMNGVKSIGDSAFERNTLGSFTLPPSVEYVGKNSFNNAGLETLTLQKGLQTIGEGAFGNNKLIVTSIPSTVTGIGKNAFHRNNLLAVKIFTTTSTYGADVFKDNPGVGAAASALTIEGIEYSTSQVYAGARGHTFKSLTAVEPEPILPNESPVGLKIDDQVVVPNKSLQIDLTSYFTDNDGDNLTYEVSVDNDIDSVVSIAGGKTLVFRGFEHGVYTVKVKAFDGKDYSNEIAFKVKVEEPNYAPVSEGIADQSLQQGETLDLDLSKYFSDADGDILTFEATASNGVVAVEGSSLTYSFDTIGTNIITVKAFDGKLYSSEVTFVVDVTEPNTVPELIGSISNKYINEGEDFKLDLNNLFTDSDGDVLSYEVINSDSDNSTTNVTEDGLLIFNSNVEGNYILTLKSSDGKGYSSPVTFKITVLKDYSKEIPKEASVIVNPYSDIHDITVFGLNNLKKIPVSTLFNNLDLETVEYTVINTDEEVVASVFDSVTGMINLESLKEGSSTITIQGVDSKGNRATQMFLVDVIESASQFYGANMIADAIIQAGTQEYRVPMGEVFGEVVNKAENVTYDVNVEEVKPEGETIETLQLSSNLMRSINRSMDLGNLSTFSALTASSSENTTVDSEVLYEDENVIVKRENTRLIVDGKNASEYNVTVTATSELGESSPITFNVKVQSEEIPVEEPPVEEPPVEEPKEEEPPVDEPKEEEPPVEEPKEEEPPVEEPKEEEPPVEEPKEEEPPVEEPKEEEPKEEPKEEEPPVKEPPVKEPPVQQPPSSGDYNKFKEGWYYGELEQVINKEKVEIFIDGVKYEVSKSVLVEINGKASLFSNLKLDMNIHFHIKDDKITKIHAYSEVEGNKGDLKSYEIKEIKDLIKEDKFINSLLEKDKNKILDLIAKLIDSNTETELKSLKLLLNNSKGDNALEVVKDYLSNLGNGVEVKGYRDNSGKFIKLGSERALDFNSARVKKVLENTRSILLRADNGEIGLILKNPLRAEINEFSTTVTLRGDTFKIESIVDKPIKGLKAVHKNKDGSYDTIPQYTDSKGNLVITTRYPQDIIFTSDNVADFKDIDNVYSKNEIEKLQELFIVSGTSAETYNPWDKMTRGQFAAMLSRALELSPITDNYKFKDSSKQWYSDDVQALYEAGIISGYTDGRFGGNDTLTRQQAVAMVGRALEYMGVKIPRYDGDAKLEDFNKVSDYAKRYVEFFTEKDVLASGKGISFNPNDKLNRAQMAKILMRALEISDWY